MNNNISFKAKFISSATIKQAYHSKNLQDKFVSFIELKNTEGADRTAIKELEKNWGDRKGFVEQIAQHVEADYFWKNNDRRYFALTLQREQLDQPIADKILGIAEIENKNKKNIGLTYLQVHPDNRFSSSDRTYYCVGTAMLNSLKKLFPQKNISLVTTEFARKFYRKNGFLSIGRGSKMIFKHSTTRDLPK